MSRTILFIAAVAACLIVVVVFALQSHSAQAMTPTPVTGYTLHIDALKHFGSAHPNEVAHHWCRAVSPTLTQCLLFDSDGPGGRIVGFESVVPTAVWKTFPASERALWHYHRWEIPRVHATLPDLAPAQAKKVVASLMETYGKIFIDWDPMSSQYPTGQPHVIILH